MNIPESRNPLNKNTPFVILVSDKTKQGKTNMRVLYNHHIIPLYVMIDDNIINTNHQKGGRPSVLRDSEAVTILIFNLLTVQQQTLKQIYN